MKNALLHAETEKIYRPVVSIDALLSSLNSRQRKAATMDNQHALVLAGAGSGKTKTIVARAA